MIERLLYPRLVESLRRFPVAALLGPRQVGKTTLARRLAASHSFPVVYLDLERPSDVAKLGEAELYLQTHADKLVILDEIQCKPELFPVLRALVDSDRRAGRFLLLGSASPQLSRQAAESLAGRIVYLELTPFLLDELGGDRTVAQRLWFRGGFPGSFLAESEDAASEWRQAFIRTYLERDIPQLGIRIPAAALRRFWEMLAHSHGQLWNASKIATSLGVSAPTVRHYLDILQETYIARVIEPYHANLKKRLVKSPKVYVRDSGLLYSLLRLSQPDDLFGHPALGASWEGWVIEQVLALAPGTWRHSFYRTAAGAEIDLLLEPPGNQPPIALEIKFTAEPKPSKGFWSALSDVGSTQGYVVCPCEESYPLGHGVATLPVGQIDSLFEGT
ncbi:MAG: ATP-binding protein [Pseudomonadota bacterium]